MNNLSTMSIVLDVMKKNVICALRRYYKNKSASLDLI